MINGEYIRGHGLHWITAALIAIGDIAGGSMVALPTSIEQCGLTAGFILCAMMVVIGLVSAIFLGICWRILLRHFPEYRSHCRVPYQQIGICAVGPKIRTLVSASVNITQFGIVTVYFLLTAKNLHDWLSTYFHNIPSICVWVLIVSAVMWPLSFLKSPEDFWWAIVGSMIATFLAVLLIIAGGAIDYKVCAPQREYSDFRILNTLVGAGTIIFAFGGHSTFPTIQHDMRRPKDFTKTAIMAFTVVSVFYFAVMGIGSIVYGSSVRESIINNLQTGWIQQSVNVLIAIHCFLATLIMINPLQQEAEELFKIPQGFGLHRILVRTGVLLLITFVAESVPNFGPLINLIGASTFTLTCVIFPSLFYCFLRAREHNLVEGKDKGPVGFKEMIHANNWPTLLFCGFVIIFGIIGGLAATGASIREILSVRFETPCYLRFFFHHESTGVSTSTNCCGAYQNISTISTHNSAEFCNEPNLHFYD
ncbi:hypothetical protein M3Y94_01087000 [Aphelenchoides besseyi]|nr:hypothetical protein M3Y94_01087000 [Aphelenchoides besseyi]